MATVLLRFRVRGKLFDEISFYDVIEAATEPEARRMAYEQYPDCDAI